MKAWLTNLWAVLWVGFVAAETPIKKGLAIRSTQLKIFYADAYNGLGSGTTQLADLKKRYLVEANDNSRTAAAVFMTDSVEPESYDDFSQRMRLKPDDLVLRMSDSTHTAFLVMKSRDDQRKWSGSDTVRYHRVVLPDCSGNAET